MTTPPAAAAGGLEVRKGNYGFRCVVFCCQGLQFSRSLEVLDNDRYECIVEKEGAKDCE